MMNFDLSTMCPPIKAVPKNPATTSRRSAVCRNLFGPVNHRLTEKFLTKELDQVLLSCKKDWDFDFACEVPLSGGRFVWEPSVPPTATAEGTPTECGGASSVESRSMKSCKDLPVVGDRQHEVERRNPKRSRTKRTKMASSKTDLLTSCKSYVQPTIKDYLPIRKRPTKLKKPIVFGKSATSRQKRRSDGCRSLSRSRLGLRSTLRPNAAV